MAEKNAGMNALVAAVYAANGRSGTTQSSGATAAVAVAVPGSSGAGVGPTVNAHGPVPAEVVANSLPMPMPMSMPLPLASSTSSSSSSSSSSASRVISTTTRENNGVGIVGGNSAAQNGYRGGGAQQGGTNMSKKKKKKKKKKRPAQIVRLTHTYDLDETGVRVPQCTACGDGIDSLTQVNWHPQLSVPVCPSCTKFYHSGEFTMSEGQEIYCRWCGEGSGGSLVCCDTCPRSFCSGCISRNLGPKYMEACAAADEWTCVVCAPAEVEELRRRKGWDDLMCQTAANKKMRHSRPRDMIFTDVSNGRERIPIPVFNSVDKAKPPLDFTYVVEPWYNPATSPDRPTDSSPLNNDPSFQCPCNCTDNCLSDNCSCKRLMGGAAYNTYGVLSNPKYVVVECGLYCSCNVQRCRNRLVGRGLTLKLEVFRCDNPAKGWGVRAGEDIAAGAYVTDYIGEIMSEKAAERRGPERGDEYLFTLDMFASHYANGTLQRLGLKPGQVPSLPDHEVPDIRVMSDEERDSLLGPQLNRMLRERECRDAQPRGASAGPLTHAELHRIMQHKPHLQPQDSDTPIRESALVRSETTPVAGPAVVRNPTPPADSHDTSVDATVATAATAAAAATKAMTTSSTNTAVASPGGLAAAPAEAPQPPPSEAGEASPTAPETTENPPGHRFVNASLKRVIAARMIRESLTTQVEEKLGYCVDAKWYGNVGRFINHSCDPNLEKQTVLVDNQDVLAPRLAFFAREPITKGTELTYDYGYELGSVEGKQLPCLCGAHGCRGRMY